MRCTLVQQRDDGGDVVDVVERDGGGDFHVYRREFGQEIQALHNGREMPFLFCPAGHLLRCAIKGERDQIDPAAIAAHEAARQLVAGR